MDGGEEGRGVFSISGGNATPLFERQEGIFDEMAQFVEVFVINSLNGSVFLWRNHDIHILHCSLLENRVGVITFVGDQMIGLHAFD